MASAADQSLSDADHVATEARGLRYPLGKRVPQPGEVIELAPGFGWTRSKVWGSLDHINCWVIADGDAAIIVDTGLNWDSNYEGWAQALAGRRVSQIIVTHFHPDHIGAAGRLANDHDAPLLMTRTEWLMARMLSADVRDTPPGEAFAYWRGAGWSEAQVETAAGRGWGSFAKAVSAVPLGFVRIQDGEELSLGGHCWTALTGSGHSPEHLCLVDYERRLLIAGDQVLPRITSNVSVSLSEPTGDPLGDWLHSIEKLRALPDDLLVLPGHGEPFHGLHARLERIERGHLDNLERLEQHLSEPRRVVDCFAPLFKRRIDEGVLGLATGEALAHLHWLERRGRARRDVRDGVWWFSAR